MMFPLKALPASRWLRWLICTGLFALLLWLLTLLKIDLIIADWLYAIEGNSWSLRGAWFTKTLIHEGGRQLSFAVTLVVVGLIAASMFFQGLKRFRSGLSWLLLSAVISAAVINLLKQFTGVECPWNLERYGGDALWRGFWDSVGNGGEGQCFPAGHASAAWAWIGIYFLAASAWPARRWMVLGVIVFTGVTFGVGQQLRGAHFLSHDLVTIYICWSVAYLLAPRIRVSTG